MFIQSDLLQAALAKKAQSHAHDGSRHLLCPACRVRTRLYALKDGRRKCAACGRKFDPDKKTDATRLRQCADALLCFCINFTAQQAAALSGHRYRLVSAFYDEFRLVLARQSLPTAAIERLSAAKRSVPFGVRMLPGHEVSIEPLLDDGAADPLRYEEFSGYIRDGKFQRFAGSERRGDGAEQLWAWMGERMRRYHGIWKRNIWMYLKELEWKYNHRRASPEAQALRIVELMPADFLTAWREKRGGRAEGEPAA